MPERIIRKAYARLGLMGNPTDALGGSAIALTIQDFYAEVVLYPSEKIVLEEPQIELPQWDSMEDFLQNINLRGYYGGRRLMMAIIHQFYHYCKSKKIILPNQYFSITWRTTIPPRVGLAGSSALLTAALHTLMDHYKIKIPLNEQVDIILKSETENLGIPAGPMDRVAQVYEGLTFYELDKNEKLKVEILNTNSLPPLFIAIDENSSEGTEVFHSNLRQRFQQKDPVVLSGIKRQSELARECRNLLIKGKGNNIGPLMDENFDIRRKMIPLHPGHVRMVESARKAGAHAKFAGSGGTIVGTCDSDNLNKVIEVLQSVGYHTLIPTIKNPENNKTIK